MAGRSRRRQTVSLRFRIVASLLVLAFTLTCLEAAARSVGPIIPVWQSPDNHGVIMTGNATRLWGMAPGERRNVDTVATINALGLRGAVPIVPRPTAHRVLLLGDSTFFGHGVPDDKTIAALLEATLQAKGIDADVVNGAIPGYSTEQTRILLDELGWSFEPTLLLIGNLWSDNNADGFRDADLLRTTQLYANNPLSRSSLFRLTAGWVDRARGGRGGHVITWTHSSDWPDAKARRVPLQQYAENLDAMVRDAAARGASAAFISPANRGLVENDYVAGAGWDPYFDAQRKVAAWHGIPVVSMLAALQADPATLDEKFVDVMHPSALGAADIAGAIASTLADAGWPASKLPSKVEPFDASGLVDEAAFPAGGQDPRFSPQAQLFPGMIDKNPATHGNDPDHATTPTPGGQEISPTLNGSWAPDDSGWDVRGTVSAGAGPVTITIHATDGRPLAFTRLVQPGPFTLHVRDSTGSVSVEATDPNGAQRSAIAERSGTAVSLALP